MVKKVKLLLLSLLILPCLIFVGCEEEHTHDLTLVKAVKETCTTAGNTAYYTCECGKYFSDAEASEEIAENSWVVVATGHDTTLVSAKSATCTTVGNTAYYTCECGKYFSDDNATQEIEKDSWVISAFGHDYQETEWHDDEHEHVKKKVCSRDSSHVINIDTIDLNPTNLNSFINPSNIEDRDYVDYKINLASGEYDKFILERAGYVSGNGSTATDPKLYNRVIDELSFNGESVESTKMNGFSFDAGLHVNYKQPNGAGGLDYYSYHTYTIETLKFSNMTFTNRVYISSVVNTIVGTGVIVNIENLIFENVKFDFEENVGHAIHVISENNGIQNIVVRNCEFVSVLGTSTNGILVDVRSEDDICITIDNNVFTDMPNNAMQFSGSGSMYTGNIVIKNNTITTTGDRAIRLSNIGSSAVVKIYGNVMTDASDSDGELCKAAVVEGATVIIKDNEWGAKEGLTPVKGMINSTSGASNIMDTNPRN